MTKHPGGRPQKKGERCPCGLMLASTAAKRYHKCYPPNNVEDFHSRLEALEIRTRPQDFEEQHEGETV